MVGQQSLSRKAPLCLYRCVVLLHMDTTNDRGGFSAVMDSERVFPVEGTTVKTMAAGVYCTAAVNGVRVKDVLFICGDDYPTIQAKFYKRNLKIEKFADEQDPSQVSYCIHALLSVVCLTDCFGCGVSQVNWFLPSNLDWLDKNDVRYERFTLRTGDGYWIPAGCLHFFRNIPDGPAHTCLGYNTRLRLPQDVLPGEMSSRPYRSCAAHTFRRSAAVALLIAK